MKFLTRVLLLITFFTFIAHAQTGYYDGYAVTVKGDTLKGYIYFKNWEYDPKVISFKSDAHADEVKLGVSDIRYFNINIGYPLEYEKYEGSVSTDNTNVNTIQAFRDTSYRTDTVFLKVIRKGKNVNLYSYDDNLKTRYFIAEAPQYKPVELIYRIYYDGLSSDSPGKAVNENTYKKQLALLAEKYGHMDDDFNFKLGKIEYNAPNLALIVSKINGVRDVDFTKGNDRNSPPKAKLFLMLVLVGVIAILVFSVRH